MTLVLVVTAGDVDVNFLFFLLVRYRCEMHRHSRHTEDLIEEIILLVSESHLNSRSVNDKII